MGFSAGRQNMGKRAGSTWRPEAGRRGFAVILALLLVSFLVLLLASLSVLTRVETSAGDLALRQAEARAQARFAMAVAMGKLQTYLGPDNGTTVAGRAFAADPATGAIAHPGWQGAFRVGEDNALTWLVSGEAKGADDTLAEDEAVVLATENFRGVGRGSVSAPRVPVNLGRSGGTLPSAAEIAWWIDDEAAKVPLAVADPNVSFPPVGNPNRAFLGGGSGRFSMQQVGRPRVDRFLATYDPANPLAEIDDLPNAEKLDRFASTGEASLAYSTDGQLGLAPGQVSPWTRSLQVQGADPAGWFGGRSLRWNLSEETYSESGDGAIITADDVEFRSLRPSSGVVGSYPMDTVFNSLALGPTRLPYAPILSEVMFYGHIFAAPQNPDHTIRLRYFVRGEVWNPTAFPLAFPSDSLMRGLRIHLVNLPSFRVTLTNLDGSVQEYGPFDLDEIENESSKDKGVHTWYEIRGTQRDRRLLAGETYDRLEPTQATGLARTAIKGVPITSETAHVRVKFEHKGEGVGFRLLPFQNVPAATDFTEAEFVPIFEVLDVPFKDFELEFDLTGGSTEPDARPFLLPRSGDFRFDNYTFGYHLRFSDETLLKVLNAGILPRQSWRWGDSIELPSGEIILVSEIFECVDPEYDPAEAIAFKESSFTEDLLTFDLRLGNKGTSNLTGLSDVRIFDLPSGPMWSLSLLKSMLSGPRFGFSFGEPDGGDINDALDRYFFSTIATNPSLETGDSGWTNGSSGFPDPRLEVWDFGNGKVVSRSDLAGQDASKFLISKGTVAINSTDWEAWRSILGSTVQGYRPRVWGTSVTPGPVNLSNVFARHVYGDGHLTQIDPDAFLASETGSFSARRQGIRQLSDGQLDQLAARIAFEVRDQVRRLGRPITSLSELAELGIVDRAIRETGDRFELDGRSFSAVPAINGEMASGLTGEPRFLPGFLTQGDVLVRLHPALAARSDTFRIRTYGETLNPTTGEPAGRAWAEAVVQRVPEKLDGTDPLTPALGVAGGRRFEVVSFRWLNPDEL